MVTINSDAIWQGENPIAALRALAARADGGAAAVHKAHPRAWPWRGRRFFAGREWLSAAWKQLGLHWCSNYKNEGI